jgi:hypothetical protein
MMQAELNAQRAAQTAAARNELATAGEFSKQADSERRLMGTMATEQGRQKIAADNRDQAQRLADQREKGLGDRQKATFAHADKTNKDAESKKTYESNRKEAGEFWTKATTAKGVLEKKVFATHGIALLRHNQQLLLDMGVPKSDPAYKTIESDLKGFDDVRNNMTQAEKIGKMEGEKLIKAADYAAKKMKIASENHELAKAKFGIYARAAAASLANTAEVIKGHILRNHQLSEELPFMNTLLRANKQKMAHVEKALSGVESDLKKARDGVMFDPNDKGYQALLKQRKALQETLKEPHALNAKIAGYLEKMAPFEDAPTPAAPLKSAPLPEPPAESGSD